MDAPIPRFPTSPHAAHHRTRVWADAFGVWHVAVSTDATGYAPGVESTAYEAMIAAIIEREASPTRSGDDIRARVGIEQVDTYRRGDVISYVYKETPR